MPHANIVEIKARTTRHDAIREVLRLNGARFMGTDHQIDTYFNVTSGRLKLREGQIENHLIYYQRADSEEPKHSDVTLCKSEPGSEQKAVLTRALGIRAVVDKQREIYLIGNVKFHLDTVTGLGTFVEIEAIDETDALGRDELLAQCRAYLDLLQIPRADLVAVSYSDLLAKS